MRKFLKYLFYVILAYILMYASYSIFLLFKVLDFYFVCFTSLFLVMLVWSVTGIISPKRLFFLNLTKNRAVIVLIFILFCYGLFTSVLIIESHFYERDPINALKRNANYLVRFFTNVHPFDGDSHSFNNQANFIQESSQMDEETKDNTLPPVHNVTIDEVKQDFPQAKRRRKRKDGPVV